MLAIRAIVDGALIPLLGPPSVDRRRPPRRGLLLPRGARSPCRPAATIPPPSRSGSPLGGIATVGLVWWLARSAGGPVAGAGRRPAGRRLGPHGRRVGSPLEPGVRRAGGRARAGARRSRGAGATTRAGGPLVGHRGRRWPASRTCWRGCWLAPIGVLALAELRRGPGAGPLPWLAAAAGHRRPLVRPAGDAQRDPHRIRRGPRAAGGPGGRMPREGRHDAVAPARRLRAAPRPLGAPACATSSSCRDRRRRRRRRARSSRAPGGAGGRQPCGRPGARLPARPRLLGRRPGARDAPGSRVGAPVAVATVTPLYVDHYHLALDPIVFALLGIGAAVLWRRAVGARRGRRRRRRRSPPGTCSPCPLPAVNADGGLAGRASLRASGSWRSTATGRPRSPASPQFKKTTAVDYPVTVLADIRRLRRRTPRAVTVLCDAALRGGRGAGLSRARRGGARSAGGRDRRRAASVSAVRGGAGALDLRSTRSPAADGRGRCARRTGAPRIGPARTSERRRPSTPAFAVPETRERRALPGRSM